MRAATEEDVKNGNAIFYIEEGRSKPYDLGRDLPTAATPKADMEIDKDTVIPAGTGLTIIQAEIGDTGDILIGSATQAARVFAR